MAQSQPNLGRLESFYGTYKRVIGQCRKPTAHSSTFGFCRNSKPKQKNQKSLNFANAQNEVNDSRNRYNDSSFIFSRTNF